MRITGLVYWFDVDRGYGMIRSKDHIEGLEDIFFHYSEIDLPPYVMFKSLPQGWPVIFDLKFKSGNRAFAESVAPLEESIGYELSIDKVTKKADLICTDYYGEVNEYIK